jgi:queuosine precursor transporter
MIGYIALAGFIGSIPLANWLINTVGTVCIPNGPCLIPVGFGLMSPSGVLVIGAALVLRDIVHERLGWRWALAGILAGGLLSGLVAPQALVVASIVAFMASELADMAVYTPLRKRRLWLAVIVSGGVGAVVDSGLFLWIAFGSLDHVAGNVVGKVWMSALAVPLLFGWRHLSHKSQGGDA